MAAGYRISCHGKPQTVTLLSSDWFCNVGFMLALLTNGSSNDCNNHSLLFLIETDCTPCYCHMTDQKWIIAFCQCLIGSPSAVLKPFVFYCWMRLLKALLNIYWYSVQSTASCLLLLFQTITSQASQPTSQTIQVPVSCPPTSIQPI